MSAGRLRVWLDPLGSTPLHPQWLVRRDLRRRRLWVAQRAYGRVLDIGCADGWARSLLSQCDYVGLDYPTTATGLYGTQPEIFADGASLPFVPSSFDTVLLLEVLEHVVDAERVLAEIAKVLKPGGTLMLSMPFLYPVHDAPHDYRRYTAPGLNSVLLRAGLRPCSVSPRNTGFEAVALLAGVACAQFILDATRRRRWRLLLAPFLILAIPVINILGWLLALLGEGTMLASGYTAEAEKP